MSKQVRWTVCVDSQGIYTWSISLVTGWYVFDKKETSAVLFVITEWE